MSYNEMSLKLHEANSGKTGVVSKVSVKYREDSSVAYMPGVAEPYREISIKKSDVYKYTAKKNLVAVATDGTAALGLGDINPETAMPVVEGKAILFKEFAGVDAFPICLDTKDTEEIAETVKRIAPGFGGINPEDISTPRCFEIERRLKEELDIPVFYDDQHGTAIMVAAGLLSSLQLVSERVEDISIVINGAGSAEISICRLLLEFGAGNVVLVNRQGAVSKDEAWLNSTQRDVVERINCKNERGPLADIMRGKDVFIGVSAPNVVTTKMVASMSHDAIVFATASPVPGVMPEEALESGARVVATGRSDYPNQINNVLVLLGIFHGMLDVLVTDITEEIKLVATRTIASAVKGEELKGDYIIPGAFSPEVAKVAAGEVGRVARELGITKEV